VKYVVIGLTMLAAAAIVGYASASLEVYYRRRVQRKLVQKWATAVREAASSKAVLAVAYPGDEAIGATPKTVALDIAAARYRHAKAEQRSAELREQVGDAHPVIRLKAMVAAIMEDADVYSPRITSPSGLRARYEQTLRGALGMCGRGEVVACEGYAALVRQLHEQYSHEEVHERFGAFGLEPPPAP